MPTTQERSEIQAHVNVLIYPDVTSPLSTTELDYILDKKGDYRELAILEAARGIIIKKLYDPARVDALTEQIESLRTKIKAFEVMEEQAKKWMGKYDNMSYKQIAEGVIVQEECPDCINGVRQSDFDGSEYPCYCALGQQRAKTTNYMGPITTLPAVKSKTNLFVDTDKQKEIKKALEAVQAKNEQDVENAAPQQAKSKFAKLYAKLFGEHPEETLKNSPVPDKATKCQHTNGFVTHQTATGTCAWMCAVCSQKWTGTKQEMAQAVVKEFPSTTAALKQHYDKKFVENLKATMPKGFPPVANANIAQYKDYANEGVITNVEPQPAPSPALKVEEESTGRKFRNAKSD
jgi:hypothetical protein